MFCCLLWLLVVSCRVLFVAVVVVVLLLVLNREEAVVGVRAHDSSHAPTKAERKVVRCLSLSHR